MSQILDNKVSFTAGRVSSFECPPTKRDAFLWDTKSAGLGIRAYPSGKKSYLFQAAVNGITKRSVIGPVDAWDIDSARQEANRLRILADKGISPADAKRKQQVESRALDNELKRQSITLLDICQTTLKLMNQDGALNI